MSAMASQITGVSIVYSTVCSGADQRKHQNSASLAFMRLCFILFCFVLVIFTMMTSSNGNISALLAILRGIHRSPLNSPHKGQWRGASIFSLMCVWINSWVNNHEAGDLRRYRVHYDIIVMTMSYRLDHSWSYPFPKQDNVTNIWQLLPQVNFNFWLYLFAMKVIEIK